MAACKLSPQKDSNPHSIFPPPQNPTLEATDPTSFRTIRQMIDPSVTAIWRGPPYTHRWSIYPIVHPPIRPSIIMATSASRSRSEWSSYTEWTEMFEWAK